MMQTACATGLNSVASRLSFHPQQAGLFLTRSIEPSIDVATSSSACFAVSRTGDALQHDTTAWPETISPRSLSSLTFVLGQENKLRTRQLEVPAPASSI